MKLVKVNQAFYDLCEKNNVDAELMKNEAGRPCVLLVQLLYKGIMRDFVVPLRSNISSTAPKEQFLSLPPNPNTKPKHKHGVHYIKLFPIDKIFVDKYHTSGTYYDKVLSILERKESIIIENIKSYLSECENGNKHPMTPNIDGIINMINTLNNKQESTSKELEQ